MAFEPKPNTGALFSNTRRRSDSDPNAMGTARFECRHCGRQTDMRIAAWENTSKGGMDYIKLNMRPADDKPAKSFADKDDGLDDFLK